MRWQIAKLDTARLLESLAQRLLAIRRRYLAYISPWRSFVYVPYVIAVFVRWIVGWRISGPARTGFVLGALG